MCDAQRMVSLAHHLLQNGRARVPSRTRLRGAVKKRGCGVLRCSDGALTEHGCKDTILRVRTEKLKSARRSHEPKNVRDVSSNLLLPVGHLEQPR